MDLWLADVPLTAGAAVGAGLEAGKTLSDMIGIDLVGIWKERGENCRGYGGGGREKGRMEVKEEGR